MMTCAGKTQCLAAWAEDLGIPTYKLAARLKRGMSLETIVQKITKDPVAGLEINPTGFRGIRKIRNKWNALIVINGKRKILGIFETPELAAAAYEAAKKSKSGPAVT